MKFELMIFILLPRKSATTLCVSERIYGLLFKNLYDKSLSAGLVIIK
jgi:hypothetical protein